MSRFRPLTNELSKTLPVRRVLADTEDFLRRAFAKGEPFPSVAHAYLAWLRGGRRTVLIDSPTVARLLASDCDDALPADLDPVELVFADPVPDEYEVPRTVAGGIAWLDPLHARGWAWAPGLVDPANPLLMAGSAISLSESGDGTFPSACRIARAALRALADERRRVLLRAPGSVRRASRKATGASVARLRLLDGARAVERTVAGQPASFIVNNRGAVAAHPVREHLCRVWVLDPGPNEAILGERGNLRCVARPRRAHVRGRGDVRSGGRVERLTD